MRGDQLTRQWRLLMYLSNSVQGRRLKQIAEEIECSERNVRRDIVALQAAGFAIYSEKLGQTTVWKMPEALQRNSPLPLTTMEIFALLMAETELSGSSDFISQSFSQVTEKILKSRPPAFREQMELLKERFYTGAGPVKSASKPSIVSEHIVEAISSNQKLSVKYRNASGAKSNRILAPLHIWLANGSRYLVAYCYEKEEVRTFNLKRFLKVEVQQERFKNRWQFDMQKHAQETFGVFHARPERIEIWLDPILRNYIDDHPLHSSQTVETLDHDGLIVRIRVGINESLVSRIMGFGSLARVLSPDKLAIVVMEKHRSAAELYAQPLPGKSASLPLEFA